MRDRLIELIESARFWGANTSEEIADRLIAVGVIVPPCKVGDKIYALNARLTTYIVTHLEIYESGIKIYARQFNCHNEHWMCWADDFGNNEWVFLTREEAEKALAEWSKE